MFTLFSETKAEMDLAQAISVTQPLGGTDGDINFSIALDNNLSKCKLVLDISTRLQVFGWAKCLYSGNDFMGENFVRGSI